MWLNELQSLVGQVFSLPDFCHGLIGQSYIRTAGG
jgi:hypothetical protein